MDNKSKSKKRYYKLILLVYCLIGVCFSADGIGMTVLTVKLVVDCVKASSFDVSVLFSTLMAVAFGIFAAVGAYMASKYIYNWTMYYLTKKKGEVYSAQIIKWKEVVESRKYSGKYHGITDYGIDERYYGCEVLYDKDGIKTYGKTDAVYNRNEMEYLRTCERVNIKAYKKYVVIEDFPDEIYAIDLIHKRKLF